MKRITKRTTRITITRPCSEAAYNRQLHKLAVTVADAACLMINQLAPVTVPPDLRYRQQATLEELIAELQRRV